MALLAMHQVWYRPHIYLPLFLFFFFLLKQTKNQRKNPKPNNNNRSKRKKKSKPQTNRSEFWGEYCWFLRTFPNRQASSVSVITVYHNIFFLKQLEIPAKCSAVTSLWKSSWESMSLFLLFHFWESLCTVLISTALK